MLTHQKTIAIKNQKTWLSAFLPISGALQKRSN
jgi:hypothetical protein